MSTEEPSKGSIKIKNDHEELASTNSTLGGVGISDRVEQVDRAGGSVGDSNCNNSDHDNQDNHQAEFNNNSGCGQDTSLDNLCKSAHDDNDDDDDDKLRNLSWSANFELASKSESGADCSSLVVQKRQQNIVNEKKKQEDDYDVEQLSLIGSSCNVTFNSDNNNNDLDGGIDCSNSNSSSNYNQCENTYSSSSDISGLHISNTIATNQSDNQSNYYNDNDRDNNNNNTANHSDIISLRKRKIGNSSRTTHGREDHIDLITTQALPEVLPVKLNWNQQQRYKKQKLKIMIADGKSSNSIKPANDTKSHQSQRASAYFCRLSRDDFGSIAGSSYPTPSSTTNRSSQSDIFESIINNQKRETTELNDNSIRNKYLSYAQNFFTRITGFRQSKLNSPSKLKQSNKIILQDRQEKKTNKDVINHQQEPTQDTSSHVTDEEESSGEMSVISNSGYKTFKGSEERRHSKSGRKTSIQSRESQRRLSQISGYSKLDHHHYQTETKKISMLQELKRIVLLLIIILLSCFLLWKVYELLLESYNFLGVVTTPSILGEYNKFAVSTDAQPCAKVGSDLLANGGSAVDAAIGTLLCMGVILPNSLGLGGGCLMTIYDGKKKEAIVIDGRETAPDYAEENMFVNGSLSASRGPLSVAVPGELAAYWQAHQRFGKLKWSQLFNDTIKYAEEGFPMVSHLADALKNQNHAKYLTPMLSELFTHPEGRYYKKGEIFAQPALAETLKRIRDNGVSEFYIGQTGQNFIQDLKDQGGRMTLTDLLKYEAVIRVPLKVKLADDLILHTQPPPGSGIVLSIILRVMHKLGYYKNLKPQTSVDTAELYYHRLAESFKFAYGQRAGLEDTPDNPERMNKLMEKLTSEEFINEIASKVDTKTHDNHYYGGLEYFQDDHGTAHVSVLDSEGNAAAISTSVNLYFGSGMYSPSTGIVYNDVMDDFVSPHLINKFGVPPSKYNRIRPGRRPLSSMVPSVFTDSEGNVKLVIGGAGGTMITTSVAMVSLRNQFLGEDIKTSIDGPRIHHQFLPNQLYYEVNFPRDLIHALHEIRNHTMQPILGRSSVIMAIASEQTGNNNRTRITANSDYRKGGSVHGQ